MIVYVKTFNRPFYLDRCLASIKALGRGISGIVALDDGTEPLYLERLAARHPDVEWRYSGGGEGKWDLVCRQRFEEIEKRFIRPQEFWSREIASDSADYFCLFEDDTWLTRALDFSELGRHMREQSLSICRLFWGDTPSGSCQRTVAVKALSGGLGLALETAMPKTSSEVWGFFLVCMSCYERRFYEMAHAGIRNFQDEPSMLKNVFNDFQGNALPRLVARLTERAACQGWAIPGRSDAKYYAMGVPQHLFVDLLNTLWLAGDFDPLRDFPRDFDMEWLCSLFAEHFPAETIQAYRDWRRNDPGAKAFPGMQRPGTGGTKA